MIVERLPSWPDLAAMHAAAPDRYPYLLESAAHGTPQARWDLLMGFPGLRLWQASDGGIHWSDGRKGADVGFLTALEVWWRTARKLRPHVDEIPFRGGWFVFCSYEVAAEIEPTVGFPIDPADPLPRAFAVRIPMAVLRDHQRHQAWLVVEDGEGVNLEQVKVDLATTQDTRAFTAPITSFEEEDPSHYLNAVERARQYIYDGDIFQANLSRRWEGQLQPGAQSFDCYRSLRRHNPAPFAAFVRWSDDVAIASSSPERLVRVVGDRIDTRPIAGTRPRGRHAEEDQALLAELLAHPKERAEHVMLIDLERNDLGRVSEYGSVIVDEMMTVESYATVHHIVSNITGQLRPGTGPGAVIAATFPGGTITGCPKVRCMAIIAELEGRARGAYTGSLGWLDHSGDMDLNILIRTLTVRGNRAEFRAGGGIVADSIAERELDESRAKAAGLLRALEAAG